MNIKYSHILAKIHYFITRKMSESSIVNNYLIATITEDGETYDCIYCTILRNSVLFTCIGFTLGFIFGRWV